MIRPELTNFLGDHTAYELHCQPFVACHWEKSKAMNSPEKNEEKNGKTIKQRANNTNTTWMSVSALFSCDSITKISKRMRKCVCNCNSHDEWRAFHTYTSWWVSVCVCVCGCLLFAYNCCVCCWQGKWNKFSLGFYCGCRFFLVFCLSYAARKSSPPRVLLMIITAN